MYKIKIVIIAHITRVFSGLSTKPDSNAGKDSSEIGHIWKDCNYLY